ncbi:hypothetical protein ACFS07_15305 [Undibacterium arcticum]
MSNAGICSLKMKDGAAAERYFLQSFRFDPSYPPTSLNLAKKFITSVAISNARGFI